MDSDHRPCICKYVNLWLKGAREDSGTAQWMKANTRECPKCHHNIEKAGGCKYAISRSFAERRMTTFLATAELFVGFVDFNSAGCVSRIGMSMDTMETRIAPHGRSWNPTMTRLRLNSC